ncbi:IstB-like ATP binding protein [Butyrivibrio proteoclasticus]|nr:IstB-like ATP binding protein [Butyrivibrio proteoclasticus]
MLNDTEHKNAYIEAKMKQFKLVDMRTQYRDIIQEAEQESLGYMDFLLRLLELEDSGKTSRRTEKLLVKAGFDSASSLEDIDYSFNPSLDKDKIDELGRLTFLDNRENIIIIGPPGVGKSMIATGIGRNACRK